MAGEKTMGNPEPINVVLKSEAVPKLDTQQDVPSGKLGIASDLTSTISSTPYPSSGANQDLVGESGANQSSGFENYYYPGYDGPFTQSDDKGYFLTDGSQTGVQSENGSLVYYLPGYNPYATGALMGVDGQCLGQQPYYSSGYYQHPVSYGSEAMPCYTWDSTYAVDVSNGDFDGFGNVKYGSGSAFAKSDGFNSTKSNGLGAKLSRSTYTQPNKALSKGPYSGSDISAGSYRGYYQAGKSPSFNNQKQGVSQYNGPMNYRQNGRIWNQNDRYRKSNRDVDFENSAELTRGPRTSNRAVPLDSSVKKEDLGLYSYKDKYNLPDFEIEYENAKFFVIKSYSEDDVHKSMKFDVWSSTPNGNKKLDAAFHEADTRESETGTKCPIFLFFSVNGSGQFVGLAEMIGKVDFNKDMDFWQLDKWNGFFPVKWHVIKDIPNKELFHIILENNENKPVTHSRDTQKTEELKVMARELGRPSSDEEWIVFVDNLSKRVTRSELREIFIQYGKVVRVYIPNVIFKPNYKSSTFAFVQFALEKSCSRAVQNVNGTLIDGKRVSVGVAKYKKNSRGGTVGNKLQSAGNKQVIGDRGWQQVKTKKASSLRNGRTYDEVLMGDSSKNMEQVIVESEGGKGLKDNEVRNVWDMHIPNDDYGWVKYSLTGVVKYPLQPNMVKKAMAKEGFQVKIVSWGFVTNAVIVMFKSNEDFVKAWSNYRDKLFSWFQWLSPVMSEDGVPLAYGLVELVGLPLLCWNVPFLEKLAGRWGDLVCILDETRNKEDLSSARLLLRAASPYDIQESIIVGSYGRSFKVKISLGGSYYAATDVSGEELQEIPVNGDSSGKKVDSRGKSAEVVGTEVGTWGQKVVESGGFEEGGEHSLEKSSYTKSYGYGLSGNLECVMEPVSNKEYAGLGLRDVVDQSCSAQSDSNWDSFSPVTKIIPKGPAVKLKWDGLEEHNKCQSLHELIEVDSGGLRDKEGEGVQEEEENRMQMKVVSQSVKEVNKEISVKRKKRGFPVTTCMTLRAAQDGKKKKGHYARVYKRSRNRRIWFNSSNDAVFTGSEAITIQDQKGSDRTNFHQPSLEDVECVEADISSSLKFRRNSRKNRRGLINLALELVSINTAFSPVFSKLVEEAMATWEVSILLGISFKDGKETFIEKILCLEKGSEVVKDDGYDG